MEPAPTSSPRAAAPRYGPDRPLPPYAFFSPRWPHPRLHPDGHSYGAPEPEVEGLDPRSWRGSEAYLRGIDLFNRGYHWEAHEQWEALWHAAGRQGPVAEMLKALIKLTAAGVKMRQGRARGIRVHAAKAREHIEAVRYVIGGDAFLGLRFADLLALANEAAARSDEPRAEADVDVDAPVALVFDRFLVPGDLAEARAEAHDALDTPEPDTSAPDPGASPS